MANTWDQVIELGNIIEVIEYGETIQAIDYREVFANKKSVRQSEFYQAANAGLKPELLFEVHSFEFNNDEKVRYNNKEYSIIRTHEKDNEIIELIITSHVGSEV